MLLHVVEVAIKENLNLKITSFLRGKLMSMPRLNRQTSFKHNKNVILEANGVVHKIIIQFV